MPDLAVIFQPGILHHRGHDMRPAESAVSKDVVKFLIDHEASFVFGMTMVSYIIKDPADRSEDRFASEQRGRPHRGVVRRPWRSGRIEAGRTSPGQSRKSRNRPRTAVPYAARTARVWPGHADRLADTRREPAAHHPARERGQLPDGARVSSQRAGWHLDPVVRTGTRRREPRRCATTADPELVEA